jgi:hypothetical protein
MADELGADSQKNAFDGADLGEFAVPTYVVGATPSLAVGAIVAGPIVKVFWIGEIVPIQLSPTDRDATEFGSSNQRGRWSA